jgi:hypothetical protein
MSKPVMQLRRPLMNSSPLTAIPRSLSATTAGCALALLTWNVLAHPHAGPHSHDEPSVAVADWSDSLSNTRAPSSQTAGQPPFVFRHLVKESRLPEAAQAKLHLAHGGFAVDRQTGEVFFGLKGVGVIWMNNDLSEKRILPVTDPKLLQGNFHNVTLLHNQAGERFLALPDNEQGRVWILTDEGKVVAQLAAPLAMNSYYADGGGFHPTDTEYAGHRLFVADGYSAGNFILVADPWNGAWTDSFFGGRTATREHGLFGTAHGITLHPATRRLEVSDRANSRVQSFDFHGTWLGSMDLPAGSLPCDIDFHGGYALVGCLQGPGGATPAPFYVLNQDGGIVSTVTPKAELGLELFTHIHNASWKPVLGKDGQQEKLWVLTTAWNPGDFAVFEVVQ